MILLRFTENIRNVVLILFMSISFVGVEFAQSPKFELSEINFSGNDIISSSKLLKVISSKESPGWLLQFLNTFSPFGKETVYFDPATLSTDVANLKNFYRDNGFFETKIRAGYELDSANSDARISFNIDEGDESFFKSIVLNNLDELPLILKNEIIENFDIDSTERFSGELLLNKLNFARSYLVDNGFRLATLSEPLVTIDTASNSVYVKINFDPGKM